MRGSRSSAVATELTRARRLTDEVDVSHRERDVAGDDHAAAEQAVDEVDEGDVALRDGRGHGAVPGTKL